MPPPNPLLDALTTAPRLVTDLPGAPSFDPSLLQPPAAPSPLDLNQKLGHLCEDALAVLLESSPSFDLLARNLQLHAPDGTTLGELDFLLRDHADGSLVHLELAVKFYLAVETPDGLALPGPDARDNYFKKLHRLQTHQLTLTGRFHDALPAPHRDEPITVRQLIHGCLFDHVAAQGSATADFIPPDCRRGRWLTLDEARDHFASDTALHIIPKPLWPVPPPELDPSTLEPWQPTGASLDRCLMLHVAGSPLPHFVTPAGYPEHQP